LNADSALGYGGGAMAQASVTIADTPLGPPPQDLPLERPDFQIVPPAGLPIVAVVMALLTELKKPRPNPQVIERRLRPFIYSAGATGLMQVATFVIMTKLATA